MSEVPKEDTVGHIMHKPVSTVNSNDSLLEAAKLMVERGIGAVVVLDGKTPSGIVTERDVMKQLIRQDDGAKKAVKQYMSKPLITAPPDIGVQQAFELMLKNKIRRLPILEGKDLVGIVTEKDLMRWVLRVSYEPNIPKHIKAILEAQ